MSTRPRVFILQEPMRTLTETEPATGKERIVRDEKGKAVKVPVMDFRPVAVYGDPVICLPPGPMGLSPYPTKERLREVLRDFSDDDYLVPVGDPSAMFLAAMIVGDINRGRCKVLKWDRDTRSYIAVELDIHRKLGQKGEL